MDLPESLEGRVAQCFNRLETRDIGGHAKDLAAIATKFVDGAFELLGLEVGKNDLHAFGQEPLAHGLTDTAGATSDDCNLAFEFLHCSPFEQIRTLVLLARVWALDHRSLE